MPIADIPASRLPELAHHVYALATDAQVPRLDQVLNETPGDLSDAYRATLTAAVDMGIVAEADLT